MTREEILAIRAAGVMIVAQCDSALAVMEHLPAETAFVTLVGGSCTHPSERVISTSVPGFPHRAKCTQCGATVERAA